MSMVDHALKATEPFGTEERFRSDFGLAKEVIAGNIARKMPAITLAGWLGTPASAQLGYLINRILGTHNPPEHRYAMFANSSLEAIYAVIRLARQKAVATRGPDVHRVLIYDIHDRFGSFMNPIGVSQEQSLCPAVHVFRSMYDALDQLEKDPEGWAAILFVRYPDADLPEKLLQAARRRAEQHGTMLALVNSEIDLSDPTLFSVEPGMDAIIFGENLAANQVPFACFALTDEAYACWNGRQALTTYTSTFYGNGTSLSVAVEALRRLTPEVTKWDERIMALIEGDLQTRLEYFQRYVHPTYSDYFKSDKGDFEIESAYGSHLLLANGKKVLDLSGLGCSLRGHNPSDALEAIEGFDPKIDYLAEVQEEIRHITGFRHLLPSVSGAGAVDNALAAGLLAAFPRRKIVTLTGNYSGKTLPSVNFSRTAALLADREVSAFEPYYPDIVHVDPFAADATEKFSEAVAGDDVALVWFEIVQGYMFKQLPEKLVRLIQDLKARHGYLIGVDEVLTGMWKNGRTLLFQQGILDAVDITSMSKATSDMIFPVSWALLTDDVDRRARQRSPSTMAVLKTYYRNNLGAAVALNAVRRGRELFRGVDLDEDNKTFQAAIKEIVRNSPLFSHVTCAGSLIRLNLNRDWFPYAEGSMEGTLVEGAISKLLFHASGLMPTNLRLFLPALHDRQMRQEVLDRLSAGVARISPSAVYAYMLCQNAELLGMLGMTSTFKKTLIAATAA